MTRQVAFLMWASKGGLTHDAIMRLTWRQFQVYLDAFGWMLNEQTENGKKENKSFDAESMAQDPRYKDHMRSVLDRAKKALSGIAPK